MKYSPTNPALSLANLSPNQIENWINQAKYHSKTGKLPNYIPKLSQADTSAFSLQIQSINGDQITIGNPNLSFALMSVVKPFLLLYLLVELGSETVFKQVGTTQSDEPFNSLNQLQADGGWPRNPMINSGAISLASLLAGEDGASRCETLCRWLNQQANSQLFLDKSLLNSVNCTPNSRNQALAEELEAKGLIENQKIALDTYNHICCLSGNIVDLVQLGMLLAQPPQPNFIEPARTVKALMTTCGLYQASSRFAVEVGVPTKSGVSGAVLSVVPSGGVIACYSPPLNAEGNSVAGLYLLEQICRRLRLSIFD